MVGTGETANNELYMRGYKTQRRSGQQMYSLLLKGIKSVFIRAPEYQRTLHYRAHHDTCTPRLNNVPFHEK